MSQPLRTVQNAQQRWVRGSVLGPDTSRRLRIWELRLECGHVVERNCKYVSAPDIPRANGWHPRDNKDVLPAPKRARCEWCSGA